MSADNTFELSAKAAEGYESQKVPAIFAPIAKATLAKIKLPKNAQAIDIASGTGVVPRLLATQMEGTGRIACTDLNPEMLEISQKSMPATRHKVEWVVCEAGNLPFEDGEFDIAFCQQGLQFFPDKPGALAEIHRVIAPGGQLILTCWSSVSPMIQAVADSLQHRLSERAAKKALEPFAFRDGEVIASLLTGAGFKDLKVSEFTVERVMTPSRAAIRADILSTPYEAELVEKGDETIDKIAEDVDGALEQYRVGEGLNIPQETQLFQAKK